MRVLVTGATGFVGKYLLQLLVDRRLTVFGTFRDSNPSDIPGAVELLRCDLRDPGRVRTILRKTRPTQVYHLAGLSSVTRSFFNVQDVWQCNLLGALNLMEAVREVTPKARVLMVGSGQCYGSRERHRAIIETCALLPESPYAASKAAADLLGYQFFHSYGLQIVRIRPFNHTGPGQAPEFVCSDWARQVAEIDLGLRSPIVKVGDLGVSRDFSDVRDVVRAYEVLMRCGIVGEAYNVASNRATSLRTILDWLISFCSRPIHISVQPERIRGIEVRQLYGSNRKLRNATDWKPKYKLDTTLRDLYLYWKKTLAADHRLAY